MMIEEGCQQNEGNGAFDKHHHRDGERIQYWPENDTVNSPDDGSKNDE
jgi:hypothetical protein